MKRRMLASVIAALPRSRQSSQKPVVVKKSNREALQLLLIPCGLALMMILTLDSNWLLYLIGQACGALFFMQCFILLHEAGHHSLFRTHWLNHAVGGFCAFLSLIPWFNWRKIHGLHHRYTGWRNLDPTTEATFKDQLSPIQKKLVNIAWRFYIPLFSLGYRFGIFWNRAKLRHHLSESDYRVSRRSMLLYAGAYLAVIGIFNLKLLSLIPAYYLGLVICDHLILSQHSSMPMPVAKNRDVKLWKFKDQAQFTRSLQLPWWLGRYLFMNFNLHEAHHERPDVPCYHLEKVANRSENTEPAIDWFRRVKSQSGVGYIFQ